MPSTIEAPAATGDAPCDGALPQPHQLAEPPERGTARRARVRRPRRGRTQVLHPETLSPDEDFRILTEFDAARSELFLARAALLVEGQTERLALPFVFAACGYDVDHEGVLPQPLLQAVETVVVLARGGEARGEGR